MEALIDYDRWLLLLVNGSSSLYLDGVVKVLTTAATWIPLYIALFCLVMRNNNTVRRILFIVGCALLCYLLAGAVDDGIVKPLVARWRPTHDPIIGWQVDVVNGYRGGKYGFFSAHASNTFSLAVFFSLLVRSRLLTLCLVTWSLINCWTRLYLGVHFPGDILCGLLWGGTVGVLVYVFYHRMLMRFSSDRAFISTQYTIKGYQRSDIDIVLFVFVATLIYALLRACLMLQV
ncbi:MAG: phosphatase PAP2 family protein [Prevotella sp.]|jgi:undecaprenyl-diphosphatase|nr:phosphatase PAP2 family protein [Prevotella sp.]